MACNVDNLEQELDNFDFCQPISNDRFFAVRPIGQGKVNMNAIAVIVLFVMNPLFPTLGQPCLAGREPAPRNLDDLLFGC
jgi:hypothetical protein